MYGDSAASRKRVAQLREQGGDIRAMADRLVAQAESVPWTGRAAESMRTRIKERASHLRLAAGHHDTAADSLARHASEVDALKDAIETISHKADTLTDRRPDPLGPGRPAPACPAARTPRCWPSPPRPPVTRTG